MSFLLEQQYKDYLHNHKQKQNRGRYGRDSERQKCYNAEFAMLRQVENPEFKDIKEAQRYAKKIYKSKTWQKLFQQSCENDVTTLFRENAGQPIIEAKFRNTGRGYAGTATYNHVTLDTKVGLNKYTLLHELTHCLGHWHHGRSFRKTLLGMVGTFMGAEAKKVLKAEFKKRKLAYGDARKPMSFDQWNAARKKMEKIRNV